MKELKNKKCPVCKDEGKIVTNLPVKNLVNDRKKIDVKENIYYLCMNEECNISYYNNEENSCFTIEDLKKPLWYKKGASPKYICYCSKTTEEEIIKAIEQKNAKSVEDIVNLTGAMKNSDCKNNNPLGKCCSWLIKETLEKYSKDNI